MDASFGPGLPLKKSKITQEMIDAISAREA